MLQHPSAEDISSTSGILQGLHTLLYWYLPCVFALGTMVRRLTWEGRPGQSTTGEVAKRLLGHCLAVQVSLQGDWEGKSEYSRTLSLALLSWQPWMSRLPGCCFVEESCEALLSRQAQRSRTHQHLTGFQGALELFVTLPPPSDKSKDQKANVRRDLVLIMEARLRGLIANPSRQHYARTQSVREAIWEAAFPSPFSPPGPPISVTSQQLVLVMRNALVSLGARGDVGSGLQQAITDLLPLVTDDQEVARRQMAFRTLGAWSRERRPVDDRPVKPKPIPQCPSARRTLQSEPLHPQTPSSLVSTSDLLQSCPRVLNQTQWTFSHLVSQLRARARSHCTSHHPLTRLCQRVTSRSVTLTPLAAWVSWWWSPIRALWSRDWMPTSRSCAPSTVCPIRIRSCDCFSLVLNEM